MSSKNRHLVRLFAVLVLRFTLKAIRTVHILCFVVSSIDIHSFRVEPYTEDEHYVKYWHWE